MRVQVGECMVEVWRGEIPSHLDALTSYANLTEAFGNLGEQHDEDGTVF